MNHLIMSLGETAHLVAELFGFLNPENYPLYQNHRDFREIMDARAKNALQSVARITMICTQRSFRICRQQVCEFFERFDPDIMLHFHYIEGMEDLITEADSRAMRSLIYRLVFEAASESPAGHLYLCLSGGRKTMSSDIQQAANLFGCRAMIHVLAQGNVKFDLDVNPETISPDKINLVNPVIYSAGIPSGYMKHEMQKALLWQAETNIQDLECKHGAEDTLYLDLVEAIQEGQSNLAQNFVERLEYREASSQFHALMLLSPEQLLQLKLSRVDDCDLDWLYALPKTDLHCHLGGFADSSGLISIAQANRKHFEHDPASRKTEADTLKLIKAKDDRQLQILASRLLSMDIAVRWLSLSAFLSAFEENVDVLDRLVYHKFRDPSHFIGIGLKEYERIGDYQGSSLLQSESAIRAAAKLLKQDAERNNILYKEVRCSPVNYTNSLKPREVVEILWDELKEHSCLFRLIIIGSRHRSPKVLQEHADLCLELKKTRGDLAEFVCGFDLAGPENVVEPEALRMVIRPLLEECIRITIHAGETSAVEDIWKAVYELNADRIGHGLSLNEDLNLLQKLRDHRTAIELCPSSNHQISGFKMHGAQQSRFTREYPLKVYLENGIKACICTDDPGISRTDISREYLVASKLCEGNLCKWDVLSLIRNSFVSAFLPFPLKQKLIRKAEEQILNLL